MRRTFHGVPFLVYSPSHFVLDALDDGSAIERCVLFFDGRRWFVHIKMKPGPTVIRVFGSRDEAIAAMGGQHVA